jgi:hypothetical protein
MLMGFITTIDADGTLTDSINLYDKTEAEAREMFAEILDAAAPGETVMLERLLFADECDTILTTTRI